MSEHNKKTMQDEHDKRGQQGSQGQHGQPGAYGASQQTSKQESQNPATRGQSPSSEQGHKPGGNPDVMKQHRGPGDMDAEGPATGHTGMGRSEREDDRGQGNIGQSRANQGDMGEGHMGKGKQDDFDKQGRQKDTRLGKTDPQRP